MVASQAFQPPRIVTIVPVTGSVGDIQVNSSTGRVYFIHNENEVSVLDGATNQIAGHIQAGDKPTYIAVNPRTNRVYITNFRDGTVSVVHGGTLQTLATVPVGEHPYGIGVNTRTNRIFVASLSGTIAILSGTDHRVLKTLKIGGSPALLAVNERTNRVYVTNVETNSVSVINGRTLTAAATAKVGKNPIITPAINTRTNRIYVANNLSKYLSVIQGSTSKLRKNVTLGSLQSELAVNSVSNRIYVTSAQQAGKGKLFVLSGLSGKRIKTLTVPPFTTLLVNPNTNHYFVGDTESSECAVYSGKTNARIALLHTAQSAGNMALNMRTNRIYVGNSSALTVIQDL